MSGPAPMPTTDTSDGRQLANNANERGNVVVFVCLAGGLGGSTRSVATVLARIGPSVTRVLAAPPAGRFAQLVSERGLADAYIHLPKRRAGRRQRITRVVAAARITRWVWPRRNRITALHANGPEELNVVAPASLLTGIPIVVWSHARGVSPWMAKLAPLWRQLLRRVSYAAVSPFARQVLVDAGLASCDDVMIVPDPIDPEDVRAERRESSAVMTVGYLSSEAPYKGFQLLPAVDEHLQDVPLRWLLYAAQVSGQNDQAWTRMRALPPERLSIEGKVLDIRPAYGRCDIVFVPSLEESFGRVVAEAMANGIPVVASDLPPVRDLVGDDAAGLLFPVGDAAAAGQCLRRLALDENLRAKLGAAGRERARAFEPGAVVDGLARLYGLVPIMSRDGRGVQGR